MIGTLVIVRAGIRATITGIIAGDLVIEDGAEIDVPGMVKGRIIG